MAYTNRNFTWDFDALKRFYEKYIVKWLNSAVSWTEAQKKQARANLGFGDGDAIVTTVDNSSSDIDVADENGNVLMQLKDGHVKTKNFDSDNDLKKLKDDIDEKLNPDILNYGESTVLTPVIQNGYRILRDGGLTEDSTFDLYSYPIEEGYDYFFKGRMNATSAGRALITYSKTVNYDASAVEFISEGALFYVPTQEAKVYFKNYEKLSVPANAKYIHVNVRNTTAVKSLTELVAVKREATFDPFNFYNKIVELDEKSKLGEYSVSKMYDTLAHKSKIYGLTKPPVNERGEQSTHIDTSKPVPLKIVQFSDVHGNGAGVQSILEYCDIYSSYIDEIINCGDTVSLYHEDDVTFYQNIEGTEKVLIAIGNHDARAQNSSYTDNRMWSEKAGLASYNKFIAPFISNWNVVQPVDAATTGKCYYYKDYTDSNIRLIVIDNMVTLSTSENYDASQLTWFESVVQDALTNNLTIVCVAHFPNHHTVINSPFGAYSQTEDSGNWGSISGYFTAIDNFKKAGGNFVCWLCGHKHSSILGYAKNHDDQLVVSVGSTVLDARGPWPRLGGTSTELFFHHICIDVNNNLLKIVQIGVDTDLYMRKRDMMSYDYVNNTFITND